MATTQTTYTGNGSVTNYSFTFEYIKQADVKVTLDTVATTAFTFANATTLAFTSAPANGVAIRIFRDTDINTLNATFFPGSAIKAEDLNNNFTQSHFAVQEADFDVVTANTTAGSAVSTANGAVSTANGAVTTANSAETKSDAAVATANTSSTNSTAAVATANTASSNATAAVNTANTASANATTAVNTANAATTTANTALTNSRESDGSGGFNTAISIANTASTTAGNAVNTSNTANTNSTSAVNTANAATTTAGNAVTTANGAVSTANTADTNATTAVNTANAATATANTASTNATAAVATANTASTNASNAVTTANSADTNATSALTNSRESDGSGGFTSAISKANTAISTANAASSAVSNAVLFTLVTTVANIPGSPSNNDYIEIGNSTGIESFSPLSGLPSGFVGASGLTIRLTYSSSGSSWVFMSYFANDSEDRYFTKASGNTNTTNIATKMPLAGGTFTGDVSFDDNVIIKGDSTNGSGELILNCEQNSHGVKLKGPPHSANVNYTLTLPTTVGAIDNFLTTDGAGNLSWRASNYLSNGNSIINTSNAGINLSAVNSGTVLNLTGTGASITTPLTLSGNPTAANHAANKSYVDTEVAGIVDSAPGTLDTLNELAAALGDDANFSTTVTNSIGTKMPLAGGTFTGNVTLQANLDMQDNDKILLGTGDDLEIYHDGSNSIIKDNGTGKLILDTDGAAIEFQKQGIETIAIFNSDGAVELYHDNSKKLETTSTGITVTGAVTSTFIGDGSALTNLPAAGVSLGLAIALG